MKHITGAFVALMLITSCSTYMEVSHTSPSGKGITKEEGKYWVFENDTIRIVYNFWNLEGQMTFAIFNKHNKPIYIDWKKCSYVMNGTKNDYYEESVFTHSVGAEISYYDLFWRRVSHSESLGKSVKNERIVFIPPGSGLKINTSYTISGRITRAHTSLREIRSVIKDSDEYVIRIDKPDSKVEFRNYITYSTTESFANEQYVDNGFYVSSVSIVPYTGRDFKFVVDDIIDPSSFYFFPVERNQLTK